MDPERKRQIRLVVALSVAVLLAVGLIYTSFSASTEAREPSEVLATGPSQDAFQVTGKVKGDYVRKDGGNLDFMISDRDGGTAMPVSYTGQVPDPFRTGREVIITGSLSNDGVFMAQKDSLITKCPSKFADEAESDPNIQIVE